MAKSGKRDRKQVASVKESEHRKENLKAHSEKKTKSESESETRETQRKRNKNKERNMDNRSEHWLKEYKNSEMWQKEYRTFEQFKEFKESETHSGGHFRGNAEVVNSLPEIIIEDWSFKWMSLGVTSIFAAVYLATMHPTLPGGDAGMIF